MRTIGVYTSGGDSPGMNACIRAVVRSAIYRGCRVVGIRRGYAGMVAGDFVEMNASSVSNIIQLGGTILKTARCAEFRGAEGRARAAEHLRGAGIEGLVSIGGDGTSHGAHLLGAEQGLPVINAPSTIDNDLYGTDATIGFDTAVNTAVEAIDRIRDTATSHERIFFVEVMGRHAGFIALAAGAAGGAEIICVPEACATAEEIHKALEGGIARGKRTSIIVVAEGDEEGGAFEIARKVGALGNYETRVSILGHIQRGGPPSAADRILASQLGAAAVEALLEGDRDRMVGRVNGKIVRTPLPETWEKRKPLDQGLLDLAYVLAT
jgi:6-phosphofructokinase 1